LGGIPPKKVSRKNTVYDSAAKSQLGWLTLPHSPTLITIRDCRTPSGQIPRDESEQGIRGCGGKESFVYPTQPETEKTNKKN